jgi:hypothetical protein
VMAASRTAKAAPPTQMQPSASGASTAAERTRSRRSAQREAGGRADAGTIGIGAGVFRAGVPWLGLLPGTRRINPRFMVLKSAPCTVLTANEDGPFLAGVDQEVEGALRREASTRSVLARRGTRDEVAGERDQRSCVVTGSVSRCARQIVVLAARIPPVRG